MTKVVSYYWQISGDNFYPSEFESLTGITFTSKYQPGDVFPHGKGKVYKLGLGTLAEGGVPSYRLLSSEDPIMKVVEENIEILRQYGVDDIIAFCIYHCPNRCSIEFRSEELARVRKLGATLAISCYEIKGN